MKKYGQTDDIAKLILFLASDVNLGGKALVTRGCLSIRVHCVNSQGFDSSAMPLVGQRIKPIIDMTRKMPIFMKDSSI